MTGTVSITALRKARRQEQLVSKRLLREDTAAEEGAPDGAGIEPDPLSENEVNNVVLGVPGVFPASRHAEEPRWPWAGGCFLSQCCSEIQ